MTEPVRAVLVTPCGCMLAIRRDRPGRAACWVAAGRARRSRRPEQGSRACAGNQRGDRRAGGHYQPAVHSGLRYRRRAPVLLPWPDFVPVIRGPYRAGIQRGRSRYLPAGADSLTVAGLGAIDLKPPAIALLLRDAIASGRDLFTLPDVRPARPVPPAKTRFRGSGL